MDGIPVCVLRQQYPNHYQCHAVLLGTDVVELHQLLGKSTAYKDSMIVVSHMQTLWQLQEDTNTRNKSMNLVLSQCISESVRRALMSYSHPHEWRACKARWEKSQSCREHWETARQDLILRKISDSIRS